MIHIEIIFIFCVFILIFYLVYAHRSNKFEVPENYLYLVEATESVVYITPEGKIYKVFKTKDPYENSKNALMKLKGLPHIPFLHKYDDDEMSMVMEDCGERITMSNLPSNYLDQIREFEDMMRNTNVGNCDIHPLNITVKNNILYIIDWGYTCTWDEYMHCKRGTLIPHYASSKFDNEAFIKRLKDESEWTQQINRKHNQIKITN